MSVGFWWCFWMTMLVVVLGIVSDDEKTIPEENDR